MFVTDRTDEADFEEFVRALLPVLSRYAVMLTGEHDVAADLVQDVLVKAMRSWSRIAGLDRPDRYLITMVTNEHLSWRRRWAVRTIIPVGDLPDRAGEDDFTVTHAAREVMWARMATLPRRQRAVLVLRFYQRLTDAEIAEVLGCSPVTVRSHAHRALATLRSAFTADPTIGALES